MASREQPLHKEASRYLEYARLQLGLTPDGMKVLDYGCGEGDAIRGLRERGYQVSGVDIDAGELEKGRAHLRRLGIDGDPFSLVDPANGHTSHPNGAFDFVFSQQVFEHVEHLELVAAELSRVTAPGGYGFHVFPAPRRLMEGHFEMPFVQWFPKNRLRWAVIAMCCRLGIGIRPPEIPNAGPRDRADFLYRYSIGYTYYRPHAEIAKTLREAGLDVCYVVTNHRRLRRIPGYGLAIRIKPLRRALEWPLMTFGAMNLLTRRSASGMPATIEIEGWLSEWMPAFE